MSTPFSHSVESSNVHPTFLEQAKVELKRAERYRVFVSLVVLDITSINKLGEAERDEVSAEIEALVRSSIRGCDYYAICGRGCLVALFPETSRQGAETAGRRLSEQIRTKVAQATENSIDEVVPIEMASFPDAAGARSVAALLTDLADRSRN